MSEYHYDRFTAGAYNLDSYVGPELGSKAPNGPVTTTDGDLRELLDFEGRFLVLELGSITCPLFQSRRKGMAALAKQNPDVSFAILYVREAHPGADIGQPRDTSEKHANAHRLLTEDAELRPILIDDIEGNAHQAYGSFPNSVFIINRQGCVVYLSDWNNANATAKALARLKAGKSAGGEGLFLPAKPPLAVHTLKRAGGSALKDFLKDLPHLIWKNLIRRNLRVLTGARRSISPDHIC